MFLNFSIDFSAMLLLFSDFSTTFNYIIYFFFHSSSFNFSLLFQNILCLKIIFIILSVLKSRCLSFHGSARTALSTYNFKIQLHSSARTFRYFFITLVTSYLPICTNIFVQQQRSTFYAFQPTFLHNCCQFATKFHCRYLFEFILAQIATTFFTPIYIVGGTSGSITVNGIVQQFFFYADFINYF